MELPALLTAGGGIFSNVRTVNIDSLQNTTGDLVFANSTLTFISAPELIWISGNLNITNCTYINSLSFPKLKGIRGTLLIDGNALLKNITGFPALTTIGGSIDWSGSFDYATLPQISTVGGGINVQSSSHDFKCPFPELRTNGVVHGIGFICSGNVDNPVSGVNGTNLTADSSGSTASSSSDNGTGMQILAQR